MSVDATSAYYNMNHPKRGIALIFNHEEFGVGGLKQRAGTAVDCENLNEQLKTLGFEVKVYNNMNYTDLNYVVEDGRLNYF